MSENYSITPFKGTTSHSDRPLCFTNVHFLWLEQLCMVTMISLLYMSSHPKSQAFRGITPKHLSANIMGALPRTFYT